MKDSLPLPSNTAEWLSQDSNGKRIKSKQNVSQLQEHQIIKSLLTEHFRSSEK
jgi:hypothetical protein